MNNLFKIFLIFNLFSSVAPTNDYSVPLPETELKMGQNSSEVIEGGRRKLYIPRLHGGMKVTGFTPGARGELYERDCTLSFPVSLNNDKGFLTSYVCATSSVFVGDTQVGHVSAAYNFKPELGLEYAFVSVYDEFWSEKIAYDQCVQTDRGIVDIDGFIPVFPVPSQLPHPNFTVCAYGGKSELACGEIVEFGVTITVHVPGSCEKETAQFFNVTKVQMNKNYLSGDLGAPVYIPLQIPDSIQFIAGPVGQVVENVEGPAEQNI
jgi:hypothetical protein